MKRNILLIVLLCAALVKLKADTIPTQLFGKNTTYAGEIIKVFKYSDYITKTKELICIDTVNKSGEFNLTYKQNETLLITIPLGIYNTVLYTEPGEKYEVILPPFQSKQKHDILNPFFQPVETYLGIKNADTTNLNYLIAEFNDIYSTYIDSNYNHIFRKPKAANVDSVVSNIEFRYTNYQNEFFANYRKYKYAWLKYVSYMRDYRYVIREYYHNQSFLYQNPAYMDLFTQLFANYLSFYITKKEGQRLYSDIAMAKSPTFAKQTFSNNMVLINDTLQELVLLKGLSDAFNTKDFPLPNLLMTLDSISLQTTIPQHKTMAANIKSKALKARAGFIAPQFELRDKNGVFRHSKELLANYVYLNFVSLESFTCLQDLQLLKKLHDKHKTEFKIVSICIDDDFNKAIEYFNDNNFEWMLLSYRTQKNIPDEYKVRSYPSYYLIDPEGKLKLSPALSPGENFELQFYKILQAKKRNQKY